VRVLAVAVLVGVLLLAGGRYAAEMWLSVYRPGLAPGETYGIDVSHHQGDIDWPRVARDDIDFAYIKATEGGDFVDDRFASNWRAAGEAGLRRGAYHFFTLCTPGAVQAANFVETVSDDARALAPAVDLELKGNCARRPTRQSVHHELQVFLDAVESATGQRAILYLGQAWDGFETRYQVIDAFDRPLWQRSIALRPRGGWQVWQLTGVARVDGVRGPVDLNVGRL
jgi:lysozyme